MIYSSFDDSTFQVVPVVPVETKPRTLESLVERFGNMPVCPETAKEAMAERDSIIVDCDIKGYHTVEDMQMIDYLWEVRNIVVRKILAHEECDRETRTIKQRLGLL